MRVVEVMLRCDCTKRTAHENLHRAVRVRAHHSALRARGYFPQSAPRATRRAGSAALRSARARAVWASRPPGTAAPIRPRPVAAAATISGNAPSSSARDAARRRHPVVRAGRSRTPRSARARAHPADSSAAPRHCSNRRRASARGCGSPSSTARSIARWRSSIGCFGYPRSSRADRAAPLAGTRRARRARRCARRARDRDAPNRRATSPDRAASTARRASRPRAHAPRATCRSRASSGSRDRRRRRRRARCHGPARPPSVDAERGERGVAHARIGLAARTRATARAPRAAAPSRSRARRPDRTRCARCRRAGSATASRARRARARRRATAMPSTSSIAPLVVGRRRERGDERGEGRRRFGRCACARGA